MKVGLVSGSTYSMRTQQKNSGAQSMVLPLTWPQVTAFLNDDPSGSDRYEYHFYDDVTRTDPSALSQLPVVLFTAHTGHIYRIVEIAKTLRRTAPRAQKFLLGGIHITAVLKESIRAYLYQILRSEGGWSHDTKRRSLPIFRLIEIARPHMPEGRLERLLTDPVAFFRSLEGQGELVDQLDQELVPGRWYVEELFALSEIFDVTFAGLLEGDPVGEQSLREQLLWEIDHPSEVKQRTIVSLGFGQMDRIPRPNFRLYLADGNPTRLWESVVSTLQTGRTTPVALYEAGRGCQHDCDFCSVIHFFGPLRYKDPEVVHDDILYGIEELGLYDYFFTDDNLGGNPRRFRELVGWLLKIKRKHPSFIWSGQFSFANIAGHEEDIARAAESGLATCFLGLETPRPELFEKVKKHNTLNIVKTGLAILKEHHILASCNLVLGLPTDTVGFASYMMEGLRSLDVPTIAPFTCAYLPGTRLFNDLYQEGDEDLAEMVRSGWKYNNSIDVIAGTDTLTRGELYEERQEFFRQYYSYARMVDTACSFYSRVAVWKHPLQWLKGPSGLYLAVLLYNVLGYRAIHSHTHHMAGGTYSIDAEMLMRLIKDSAVRMETGFEGLLYASAANVLCRCSGALNRYLKTRGGARSMANGSKAAS